LEQERQERIVGLLAQPTLHPVDERSLVAEGTGVGRDTGCIQQHLPHRFKLPDLVLFGGGTRSDPKGDRGGLHG